MNQDRKHTEFLNLTGQIASRLLLPGAPAACLVRQVVALQVPMDSGEWVRFTVALAHGPGVAPTPASA